MKLKFEIIIEPEYNKWVDTAEKYAEELKAIVDNEMYNADMWGSVISVKLIKNKITKL